MPPIAIVTSYELGLVLTGVDDDSVRVQDEGFWAVALEPGQKPRNDPQLESVTADGASEVAPSAAVTLMVKVHVIMAVPIENEAAMAVPEVVIVSEHDAPLTHVKLAWASVDTCEQMANTTSRAIIPLR